MDEEFKVVYYEKENGKAPFCDFLFDQDAKMQKRILACIDALKIKGNRAGMPLSRKLDKNIFELRILEGNNYSRFLYFFYINKTIVLTNGFIKKSNKTPKMEIVKANIYRNDWLRRNENEKV